MDKVTFIVDGGYFTKSFRKCCGRFPRSEDVKSYVDTLQCHVDEKFSDRKSSLYRVFFYDCAPLLIKIKNPLDKSILDLSKKELFKENQRLQNDLKRLPFFALRLGKLLIPKGWSGWTIKTRIRELANRTGSLKASDLKPNMTQKGVDMRIGLDIASIAAKKTCDRLILISGDTDMIPALKLARKEGLQVCLHMFANNPPLDMHIHTDVLTVHKDIGFV